MWALRWIRAKSKKKSATTSFREGGTQQSIGGYGEWSFGKIQKRKRGGEDHRYFRGEKRRKPR